MEVIDVRGGARIGWVNATWPLAKLVASATQLRLTSVIDSYDFLPSDVVSLERYGSIPFFSSGVRIAHARSDYPSKIIFWYLGNPETLIEQIRRVGFSPTAPASSETKWRGLPVRWTALLVFILAWTGLFRLDAVLPHSSVNRLGPLTLLPLFLAFWVCWATKTSGRLQQLILRDGHSINEIRAFLSLIQIVSGILLVIFAVLVLTDAFA